MTAVPATSRGDSPPRPFDSVDLMERLLELEGLDAEPLARRATVAMAEALPGIAAALYMWVDDATIRLCSASGTERDEIGGHAPPGDIPAPRSAFEERLADAGSTASRVDTIRALTERLGPTLEIPPGNIPRGWIIGDRASPWGLLVAAPVARPRLTSDECHLLATCARWLSRAIERANLHVLVQRQEQELARRSRAEDLIVAVAHDFYNFLTPLSSRIELMRRRAGVEERRRDFQDANRAAKSVERLTDMVSDLFDAQRLATGNLVLRKERADLAALARETADAFEGGSTRITVSGLRSLDVECDPRRIRQAIENLLANAVKASEKTGTVTLTLGVETRGDSPLAVVTVSDDGPGIPRDVVPRLFVRFAAGPDSTGLGLGLYLAHEIARAHGGDITVDTQVGKGSHFHFAIPAGW